VAGVRVAGILLQAGPLLSEALLRVGLPSTSPFAGDPTNPVVLSDLFARVGGPDGGAAVAQATAMVVVAAGNVVGDNLWLWRADHTADGDVTDGFFPCDHGRSGHLSRGRRVLSNCGVQPCQRLRRSRSRSSRSKGGRPPFSKTPPLFPLSLSLFGALRFLLSLSHALVAPLLEASS
jgi:hypothetical protein